MWALVIDSVVREVTTDDPAPRFAPGMGWQPCPNGCVPGWVLAGDAIAAPVVPAPSLAQQAADAHAAGCQVLSASTPALSGTYPITPDVQQRLQATAQFIATNGRFPGGGRALGWPDTAGLPHVFATTAQFIAFATALGDYVAALDQIVLGGSTAPSALPPQPVSIA